MNTLFVIIFILFLILFYYIILKYIKSKNYEKDYNNQYINNYELNDNFKNIFCFWNSDILPPLINECVKNYKKKLPEWNIILLNEKTIHKFIDKTEFPNNYNKLTIQQKSDWMRLILLYKYGGLWMDASIIINDPSEINYMYDKVFKENYEVSGYSFSNLLYSFDNYYTFETWFIISKKGSEIIYKWLAEYEYAIEIGFDNYVVNTISLQRITNFFCNNYWIVYTCFQNTILKNKELYNKIFINDCSKNMFHHHVYNLFSFPVIFDILVKKDKKNIKLISSERYYIDNLFLEDIINKYFVT